MTLLHPELEKHVLERVRPSPEEYRQRDSVFERVKSVVEEELKKEGLEGEVTLQGSARKETWLRGNLELDVFVLFPPKDKEWIKNVAFPVLLRAAKRLGKPQVRFAEHPYVRVEVDSIPVELVPAFKVRRASEAITAVDRTPFHTEWFLNMVKKVGKNLIDEVRLLKAFFKGVDVYGAEIKVMGFSGFMCEVLTSYYGGFAEVLRAAALWRPPVVLETSLPSSEAKKRFKGYPMIVPDPTDPNRNAAAAVSLETLATTVLATRRYIERPSLAFYFDVEPPKRSPLLPTLVIEIPVRKGQPPETIWGELRRVASSLLKGLEREGFQPTRYALWSDETKIAKIAIEMIVDLLPEFEVRLGPPIWIENHSSKFLNKHKSAPIGPWLKGDRLAVVEPRKVRKAEECISNILKALKTESLITSKANINKVTSPPAEKWLAWFVAGKPKWW